MFNMYRFIIFISCFIVNIIEHYKKVNIMYDVIVLLKRTVIVNGNNCSVIVWHRV